jgi:hypothetical protein
MQFTQAQRDLLRRLAERRPMGRDRLVRYGDIYCLEGNLQRSWRGATVLPLVDAGLITSAQIRSAAQLRNGAEAGAH